jgi:glucans biosynthesis protein
LNRRAFMLGVAAVAAAPRPVHAAAPPPPGLVDLRSIVVEKARQRAAEPYRAAPADLPERLGRLNYDEYHQIWFRPERAFWHGDAGGFEVQALHRGYFFKEPMAVNLVENSEIRRLAYDPSLYDFGSVEDIDPARLGDIGFSGFRLLTDVDGDGAMKEFLVFQGASYFRSVARGIDYGLSARGVAIRTGDPRGEEFPAFVEFFIEKPQPGAGEIRLHGLLDGPSITGAFTFVARTGAQTRVDVEASLFARTDIDHVGLAPLTSMYWYSPLERPKVDDFRPRIHDSDGLSIAKAGGEWLWRPLANPTALQFSDFEIRTPRGFGLAQRTRELRDFEDTQAKYHRRPSLWIEPGAGWPDGGVQLVEIPTRNEFMDNIVASWRMKDILRAGTRQDFAYTMRWAARTPEEPRLLRVRESYSGAYAGTWRHFVIDFVSPDSLPLPPPSALTADATTSAGRIDGLAIIRYPEINGYRLTFRLVPDGTSAFIRSVLRRGPNPVSESWVYHWTRR